MKLHQLKGMELKQHTGGMLFVDDAKFSFGMYWNPHVRPKKNFHWEVTVWANNGLTNVVNVAIPCEQEVGNTITESAFEKISSAVTDWINGIQLCSCCSAKVEKNKIAGRYFAGSYCQHCWDTKYKAIEASETYN